MNQFKCCDWKKKRKKVYFRVGWKKKDLSGNWSFYAISMRIVVVLKNKNEWKSLKKLKRLKLSARVAKCNHRYRPSMHLTVLVLSPIRLYLSAAACFACVQVAGHILLIPPWRQVTTCLMHVRTCHLQDSLDSVRHKKTSTC